MGRGQLLFKGDKKKNKKKAKGESVKHAPPGSSTTAAAESSKLARGGETSLKVPADGSTHLSPISSTTKRETSSQQQLPTIQVGRGKITTSGTVVMGHDTLFEKQLSAGDALLVRVPGAEEEEMRVITMRLSNQSCNLSSGFSQSLKTPTSFRYIKKPRNAAKERNEKLAKAEVAEREKEMHAFGGTYASSSEVVYREKTETGSYRIKREQTDNAKSRGELLQLRAKKSSDKYC